MGMEATQKLHQIIYGTKLQGHQEGRSFIESLAVGWELVGARGIQPGVVDPNSIDRSPVLVCVSSISCCGRVIVRH